MPLEDIFQKLQRPRTLAERQEEDETLSVELSIEKKRAYIRRLKQAGLSGKDFGWNWESIKKYLQ